MPPCLWSNGDHAGARDQKLKRQQDLKTLKLLHHLVRLCLLQINKLAINIQFQFHLAYGCSVLSNLPSASHQTEVGVWLWFLHPLRGPVVTSVFIMCLTPYTGEFEGDKRSFSPGMLLQGSPHIFPSQSSGDAISFLICTMSGGFGACVSISSTFSFSFCFPFFSSYNCLCICSISKDSNSSGFFLPSISVFSSRFSLTWSFLYWQAASRQVPNILQIIPLFFPAFIWPLAASRHSSTASQSCQLFQAHSPENLGLGLIPCFC